MADLRMLGDRYEVRSTLGRGGMATVYEGHDRVLDRPVAIKVLAEKYAGDERFVTRFQREARAAAGLSHPNIVSVFDTGDTDGKHYIVMELVEGETLADVLRSEGSLSPERAGRITGVVAQALQAAHDQGFVHRDVKPGNVMISGGDVKVMDFGIARAATDDTLTQTGTVLGTASYLSPEQSRGDPVDHRSDIYSLGCVLYEMLTGRPPFSGGSPVSVAYKHVTEEPEPPSRLNPSVPAELESVVMRALRKDPNARFPSAEALREAVTHAVEGETTEPLGGDTAVLPVQTEPLEQPPAPRRRWVAAGVIAAILLIAGVAALALSDGGERSRDGTRQRSETPQPEESPTATPTATGVDEALFALRILVDGSAGLLPEDAAEGILDEADKASEEFLKGSIEKALEHLGKADAVILEALSEGATSEETAASLNGAVALVRQAMQAEAPTIEETPEEELDEGVEEESDSGPGNSENAPGHVKKEKGD